METADSAAQRAPGEILRDIRRLLAPVGQKVLTQAKLAKMLNFTSHYVQRLEKGHARVQRHHVGLLAEFKVDPDRADSFKRLVAELSAAVARYDPDPLDLGPKLRGPPPLSVVEEALKGLGACIEKGHANLNALVTATRREFSVLGTWLGAIMSRQARAAARLTKLEGNLTQFAANLEGVQSSQGSIEKGLAQSVSHMGAASEAAAQTAEQLRALHGHLTLTASQLDTIQEQQQQAAKQLSSIQGDLTQTASNLNVIKAKQDEASAKQDTTNRKVSRLTWAVAAAGVSITLGLSAVTFAVWHRGAQAGQPAASLAFNPTPLNHSNVNTAPRSDESQRGQRSTPGVGEENASTLPAGYFPPPLADPSTGERPKQGPPVPNKPVVKNQARAPCKIGATAIHGLCWIGVAGLRPPCPADYFVSGDLCYVPVLDGEKTPSTEHDKGDSTSSPAAPAPIPY